jgi:hypothetical protein
VTRSTWIVVAAVAALGIAAVVDALPGHGGSAPPATAVTPSARVAAPSVSGQFDAAGTLYYTDDLCRLRALRFPELQPVEAPAWDECAFSLSPDGQSVLGAAVLWEPQGSKRAAGIGSLVYVVSDPAGWEYRFPGESPAYKPDGTLTFVRDGEVVELTGYCRPRRKAPWCERVLLTTRDLFGPLRDPIGNAAVKQIAWLSPTRLVAVLALGDEEVIRVYEGRETLRTVAGVGGPFTEIAVSPRRQYAAVRVARPTGFVLIDRDARPFALMEVRRDSEGRPPFTGGRAIAWSPDDAWTAIARRETVVLFRMGRESPDVVHIALSAHDLAWSAEGGVRDPAPDHRSSEG